MRAAIVEGGAVVEPLEITLDVAETSQCLSSCRKSSAPHHTGPALTLWPTSTSLMLTVSTQCFALHDSVANASKEIAWFLLDGCSHPVDVSNP